MEHQSQKQTITTVIGTQVSILGSLVVTMWAIEIADQVLFRQGLDRFGIRPRDLGGLWGIGVAPFLHGSLYHLIGNTVPFLVLGWLVMVRRVADFALVSLISMVIGGLGTWLIGAAGSVHIGASGMIFGYLGYLLFRGFFERSLGAIALSVAVALGYGSMVWGILPSNPYISWEGHLFGFIGGIIAAKLLAEPRL
ncbi:MAG: rhomboid family intramembrane serine protease [Oscillatoriales cyanobacterium SM2_2_1]|nr:rhomboid family intramembrane serine protease [Oscillatoriales cyanobacterium SM2_2_1]